MRVCNREKTTKLAGVCIYEGTCSDLCQKKELVIDGNKVKNDKGELYSYASIPKENLEEIKNIFEVKYGDLCPICLNKVSFSGKDSIEHIYPQKPKVAYEDVDLFLETCIDNFKYMCLKCNKKKSNDIISEKEYLFIKDYHAKDDNCTYIDSQGIQINQDAVSLLRYFSVNDELYFISQMDFIRELNGRGKQKILSKNFHKYLKNSIEREMS